MKLRPGDQPLPIPNQSRDVQSQVIDDITARRQVGIERYGTALQPWNGRDALRDAYEEAIDLVMYLKQLLVEREAWADHRHHYETWRAAQPDDVFCDHAAASAR